MANTSRGVVITGAAGDLGRALCTAYLADGLTVFAADLSPPEPRQGLVPCRVDVCDASAVKALAARAGRESRPWAWVNAAGIFVAGAVAEASEEDWQRIIAVNLGGTFHGCAAAL